tara:strand:- start:506 stop:1837 length:1332 start_codon:yes stop_codon:yes gene_type:complete
MNQKIIFFIDFNENSGLGHLKRCLKLNDVLKAKDTTFVSDKVFYSKKVKSIKSNINKFIKSNSKNYDIAVIDSYNINFNQQKKISIFSKKVIIIDDLCDRKFYCDYLINYNPLIDYKNYDGKISKRTTLLLGINYNFIVNSINTKNIKKVNNKYNILIYFGKKNRSKFISNIISKFNNFEKKINKVLIFSNYNLNLKNIKYKIIKISDKNNISKHLKNSQLCIISSGIIIYEALGLKKIIFSKPISKNQYPHYRYLIKNNYILSLKELKKINEKKLINFKQKINSKLKFKNSSLILKTILHPIVDKNNNKINLEFYNSKYLQDLYSMQSKNYRLYYKNSSTFSFAKHKRYFKIVEKSENIKFLVMKINQKLIGYIKAEKVKNNSIISIAVIKKFQNLGIGSKVLKFLKQNNFFDGIPTAYINRKNYNSYKAFENAKIKNIKFF